jgi:hypothetical protein
VYGDVSSFLGVLIGSTNKRVATIDYLSMQTDAAPFCVAITVEK